METQSPSPPPKKKLAHVYCGQTAGCIKMPLGTKVGLSPGDSVLDGDRSRCHLVWTKASAQATLCYMGTRSLSPKRGRSHPKFSAHVYCGQMGGWIKMILGMEVGLSPGELDGDLPSPPQKGGGAPSPIFSPFLLWPNGCMDQDATWYGGRPPPRRHCVRWGGGKIKYILIAYFLGNICAKNCRN